MGLLELFVAVLITGLSCVNAAIPLSAWRRTRDERFALLGLANAVFVLLGALWVWGQLPGTPPEGTASTDLSLLFVLAAVLLFLLATLVRRPT
jgi:hypothetical protein